MTSQFTEDEIDYIQRAIILSDQGTYATNVKGMGNVVPQAPPVADVQACRAKSWIKLRCTHGNMKWTPIRCRWCEGCKHAWRAKVRAIILDGSQFSKPYMWTLTMKEYPYNVVGEIYDLAQSRWHKLLQDCSNRAFHFEYLRVVELQKRGTPHFHLACRDFTSNNRPLSDTATIARRLRGFAKRAGFGYIKDKTTDFAAARLGPAGIAAYLSAYLGKSEDYNKMRRKDGRAIRRYARSAGWSKPRPKSNWRYSTVGGFSLTAQSEQDLKCICGQGQILHRDRQAQAWVRASRLEGKWVGPLDAVEYILGEEERLRKGPSQAIQPR